MEKRNQKNRKKEQQKKWKQITEKLKNRQVPKKGFVSFSMEHSVYFRCLSFIGKVGRDYNFVVSRVSRTFKRF